MFKNSHVRINNYVGLKHPVSAVFRMDLLPRP